MKLLRCPVVSCSEYLRFPLDAIGCVWDECSVHGDVTHLRGRETVTIPPEMVGIQGPQSPSNRTPCKSCGKPCRKVYCLTCSTARNLASQRRHNASKQTNVCECGQPSSGVRCQTCSRIRNGQLAAERLRADALKRGVNLR